MFLSKMNERYRLDSEAVRKWLKEEDRKQSYLTKRLNCSGSLVALMLNGYVPGEDTLKDLAKLMGVEVGKLLIPKDGRASA